MKKHPFLETKSLPDWSLLTPDRVREDLNIALETAESNLQGIRNLSPNETSFENSVKALEKSTLELNQAWGLVVHLDSVCNSPELRKAHNAMLPAITAFQAKISLDPDLWHAVKSYAKKSQHEDLAAVDRRLLD